MLKLIIFLSTISLLAGAWFFLYSGPLYVDYSARVSGNGSKYFPIRYLDRALEKAVESDDTRNVIVRGMHSGVFDVSAQVEISGEDAVIYGSLVLAGDNVVRDLRVTGEGVGIRVQEGVQVELRNVEILDNALDGVDTGEGVRLLVVESTFRENKKGLYVRRDSTLTIKDSFIENNREEGLDVRFYVEIDARGNVMRGNGESGMEYILGGSSGLLQENVFEDNRASGLAFQFYPEAPEVGSVEMKGNVFGDNDHFAIRCGLPRGSEGRVSGYFRKSLMMEGDELGENGRGEYSNKCKFDE